MSRWKVTMFLSWVLSLGALLLASPVQANSYELIAPDDASTINIGYLTQTARVSLLFSCSGEAEVNVEVSQVVDGYLENTQILQPERNGSSCSVTSDFGPGSYAWSPVDCFQCLRDYTWFFTVKVNDRPPDPGPGPPDDPYIPPDDPDRPPKQAPKLKFGEARDAMEWILERQYGYAWSRESRAGAKIMCRTRISRFRIKCRNLRAHIGDSSYRGSGQVWGVGGRTLTVKARIRRLDEYCFYGLKRPLRRCSTTDLIGPRRW